MSLRRIAYFYDVEKGDYALIDADTLERIRPARIGEAPKDLADGVPLLVRGAEVVFGLPRRIGVRSVARHFSIEDDSLYVIDTDTLDVLGTWVREDLTPYPDFFKALPYAYDVVGGVA